MTAPSAVLSPSKGDVLVVRETFKAPTGKPKPAWATLEKGDRVVVDRVTDRGRLLLRGHWHDFPTHHFDITGATHENP